jgi:hypothetical protein
MSLGLFCLRGKSFTAGVSIVSGKLLVDNWLLQDVGNAFEDGLNNEEYDELVIDRAANCHSIRSVPTAGVRIEALLCFLLEIVLRDTLYIDSNFVSAWEESKSHFDSLLRSGLLRAVPFSEHEHLLAEPRSLVVQQLCVTSTLKEEQRKNEESWRVHRRAQNPYMSAVIWGTAGMLSRSHVFEAPYSAHPLRRRVMEQTLKHSMRRDAVADTVSWIANERLRIFESPNGGHSNGRQALITLPAMVIDIIEEARTAADLIPVAIQLREKYRAMRSWIQTVEEAVEEEDVKALAKYKKTLATVAKDVSRAIGASNSGTVSLKIGIDYPSLSVTLGTLDGVLKKFGIRAILNRCVFTERGEKSLNKLLLMFGVPKESALVLDVLRYLANSRSA